MNKVLLLFVLPIFLLTSCVKDEAANIEVPTDEEAALETTKSVDYEDDSAPSAIFTIGNKDNELLEQEVLMLTDVTEDAVSYYWEFGNGDYSFEANPQYKYKIHGYYDVSLITEDANGNIQKSSQEVLVLCLFGGGKHDQ